RVALPSPVIRDVAGVVADFHVRLGRLADNLHQAGPGTGVAAVLLDGDDHAIVAGERPQFLEALDPHPGVVAPRAAHGQNLADSRRGRLADAVFEGLAAFGRWAEQQHRLQAEVATLLAQFLRSLRRCVTGDDRNALAC